jgi:serine protease Do
VGNAYGYEHTVTEGIISALRRAVQVSDAQFYDDLIQTDASINPGNSGGPLLNIDGEMIGINVAVRAGAQGIGFAIPVDKALDVVSGLLSSRNGQGFRHGLVVQSRATTDAGNQSGVLVVSIQKDSPAAEAGIKPGDVITQIDGEDLASPIDFERSFLERTAGDQIHVALRRESESMKVDLKLAAATGPAAPPSVSPTWEMLGLELREISDEQFRRSYKTRYRGGLTVVSVRPDSPAAKQGIRPGDVLVGMHVWETVSLKNVSYILDKRADAAARNQMKFYILRDGSTLYGYFSLASKGKETQR